MGNVIKSGTTIIEQVASRAVFKIGVDGSVDYGPTDQTGFYNGITPPASGYTIYVTKETQGPSIHVANDDTECVFFLKSFGATGSTISDVLAWANGQTNIWVTDTELTTLDFSVSGSTPTPTPSITPTNTVTPTPSITPTNTITPTPSITPTNTITPTPTPTITPSTVVSSPKRILFLGDTSVSTVATNVSTYLTNIGEPITYSAVTMSTTYAGSGLSTSNYDAVVIYTNSSQVGAAGLSTALTNFVNSGGSVVSGVFLWNLYPSGFSHSGTTAFNFTNSQSNNATGNFTVSTATKITNNIGTSFGGFSFTNSNPTLVSGATLYASYSSDSTRLLAIRTVGSATLVSINTFFASITSSTSTLCKLVGNSIMYATGVPIPTVTSFTSAGTTSWVAPEGVTSVDYLIVGGGGGGANGYDNAGGGGGGAGMLLTGTTSVVPGNTYTVTVGAGGAGGANTRTNNAGSDGQSSVFDTITALGGGGGLGSRSGGAVGAAQVGSSTAPTGGGGSGGGAGGKGGGGTASAGITNTTTTGGAGGSGTVSTFTLTSVTYGVGGGGGNAGTTSTGTNGTANTGNGGKAGGAASSASAAGGTGGSGIVVLRY